MGEFKTVFLTLLRGVWQRRWTALTIAWIVSVVGWVIVMFLPDQFQVRTRIHVATETLLAPLLKGIAVESNMAGQVAFMRRTLTSRPNLIQVARDTDLDLTAKTPLEFERLIERLGEKVVVESDGRNLFSISYQNTDPEMANRVVRALLNIFVENNLGGSREEMASARAFLEGQLRDYERQLQEADRRLAEFKSDNIEFGSSSQSFSQKSEEARRELDRVTANYEDAVASRNQLRAQIRGIPAFVEVDRPTQIVLGSNGQTVSGSSSLQVRIIEQERELDTLRGQFTEEHPDVVTARRTLAALKEEMRAAEEAGSGSLNAKSKIPNPLYEKIKLKLVDAEADVTSKQRRVAGAAAALERLEDLSRSAPATEARLSDLTRDYEVIRKNYEELLERRESARLAQAVDAETEIQFRIVDPPQTPKLPVGPNRPLFMGVVLVIGIISGVGFVFLLAQMDTTFESAAKLREAFGLPVLGTVTDIAALAKRRFDFADSFGLTVATVCLLGTCGALIFFEARINLHSVYRGLEGLLKGVGISA